MQWLSRSRGPRSSLFAGFPDAERKQIPLFSRKGTGVRLPLLEPQAVHPIFKRMKDSNE